jgi:hypothetical protein
MSTGMGRSQAVRQRFLVPPFPGSNPGAPATQPHKRGLRSPIAMCSSRAISAETSSTELSISARSSRSGFRGPSHETTGTMLLPRRGRHHVVDACAFRAAQWLEELGLFCVARCIRLCKGQRAVAPVANMTKCDPPRPMARPLSLYGSQLNRVPTTRLLLGP